MIFFFFFNLWISMVTSVAMVYNLTFLCFSLVCKLWHHISPVVYCVAKYSWTRMTLGIMLMKSTGAKSLVTHLYIFYLNCPMFCLIVVVSNDMRGLFGRLPSKTCTWVPPVEHVLSNPDLTPVCSMSFPSLELLFPVIPPSDKGKKPNIYSMYNTM